MHGTPAQGAQQGSPIRIETRICRLAEDEPRDQCNRKTRVPRRPDSASLLVAALSSNRGQGMLVKGGLRAGGGGWCTE